MKIALHGRSLTPVMAPHIKRLMHTLKERGVELMLSELWYKELAAQGWNLEGIGRYTHQAALEDARFFMSIGGDGTLLDAVAQVGSYQVPIVGINAGRLGFLATIAEDHIDRAIEDLLANRYTIDERALIRIDGKKELFGGVQFGLNEVTVLKADVSSMITVHTYINGEYLNSYWADGLIVSTPTGSTGYNLSCGGPLVLPQSANFVITPVSPHNLTVRPMVVSDRSIVTLEVECRANTALVSVDSRSEVIETGTPLIVRKESFSAKLVKFEGYNFFDTLRQKLNWGLDARN
jgi:NAD+ kinase